MLQISIEGKCERSSGNIHVCLCVCFLVGNHTEMVHRIKVHLKQADFPGIELMLNYILKVLPSTEQLQTDVFLPIPISAREFLLSHSSPEAALVSKGVPGPFDHTLARALGVNRHCLPLLSALSSPEYLGMIYRLPTITRRSLLHNFLEDLQCHRAFVKGNTMEEEFLENHYSIARLISNLHAPICRLPSELLSEIFLISVEKLGIQEKTLQLVCRTWRDLVAALWGRLQVSTWTETKSIERLINRGPRSLDVVIDTAEDGDSSFTSEGHHTPLAAAWASASRWRTLTINSLSSTSSVLGSSTILLPHVPFNNLESLSVGTECDVSGGIQEIMEAIASSTTPKLTSLIIAATTAFRQLNHPGWVNLCSRLTTLEVNIKFREPVDILRHCARLEILRLCGVIVNHLSTQGELPLLQTLRQLWLKRASVQWMVGHVFMRLGSCTLFRPVDPHAINGTSTIGLPVCTSIILESHLASVLAAFHAPMVDQIKFEGSEWSKTRGELELGRVWNFGRGTEALHPRALSLKMLCSDRSLLSALQQMATLEELTLDLPYPSALGASFFESICAIPTSTFTGRTRKEWDNWRIYGTKWKVNICPSLRKLKLRYARWLRKGEMDAVTPVIAAVAWSRSRSLVLQEFDLGLGGGNPLQLAGISFGSEAFRKMFQMSQRNLMVQKEVFCNSLTAAIYQFIGFSNKSSGHFPCEWLGEQYYSSFFHRLRVFHHHPLTPPSGTFDVLPFFERLEELDVSHFHFKTCPLTVNLPLCRTLQVLRIYKAPLGWIDGRKFNQVVECWIGVFDDAHIRTLSSVEMPTCKRIVFAGYKYLKILAVFRLPSLDTLVITLTHTETSSDSSGLVQDIALPLTTIRPRVLQISMEPKDESLVSALLLRIDGGLVVELCEPVSWGED